jgi:hypothetical protein
MLPCTVGEARRGEVVSSHSACFMGIFGEGRSLGWQGRRPICVGGEEAEVEEAHTSALAYVPSTPKRGIGGLTLLDVGVA